MLNTITNKLSWVRRAYVSKQNRRATEKALSELNDFELNDIGLCRGDIKSVARGDKIYRKTY
jgi:uncharacterized protein YjiS (DUF1127 family)